MGRVVTLLIALALLLTLAALSVRVWREHEARQITFPTGERVELLGVRKAGETFTTETRAEKIARRYLPSRWLTWLPPTVSGSCSSGDQSVAVYLRVTDPSGAAITATPWSRYFAEDDGGFAFNREGGYGSSFGSRRRVEYWRSDRPFLLIETLAGLREDELRVRLTDSQGREIKLKDDGTEYGSMGKRTFRRSFDPPVEMESMDLSVIVSRPLAFEFLVNPADAR